MCSTCWPWHSLVRMAAVGWLRLPLAVYPESLQPGAHRSSETRRARQDGPLAVSARGRGRETALPLTRMPRSPLHTAAAGMSALLLLYVNWGALQAECLRKDTCDIWEASAWCFYVMLLCLALVVFGACTADLACFLVVWHEPCDIWEASRWLRSFVWSLLVPLVLLLLAF